MKESPTPEFTIEYFRRIQATLENDEAFKNSLRGVEAEFGIGYPGKQMILSLKEGRLDIREGTPEQADAGVFVSEEGWKKLMAGTNPARLLITRKLKLQGNYMRYAKFMGPVLQVLEILQGKRPLVEVPSTVTREPSPAPMTSRKNSSPAPEAQPLTPDSDPYVFKKKSKTLIESEDGIPTGVVRLAIMRGAGIPVDSIQKKPVIAIANTWAETTAGHVHLRELARHVRDGILEAGGVPLEFNVLGPCDAYGNGNSGMRYILAQREIIADSIETFARSHWFDGLVTMSSCDKSNPGVLMAIARLDLPAICVTGGSNMMNARFQKGYRGLNHQNYEDMAMKLETTTCATCGSCELMTTANTMQAAMEAMGMALPGSATIPGFMVDKQFAARAAGRRIVGLIKEDLRPSKIMTYEAFENAIMVDMAIGGSTNATLHLPAIAHECGFKLDLELFNKYAARIPTLAGIAPSGPFGMFDLHQAGGIFALMKRIEDDLHLDALTVTGRTLREELRSARVLDDKVITSREKPFYPEGGTVILRGNLAPRGSVIKQSAVAREFHRFRGPARVFNSEADTLRALQNDQIQHGDAVVIRYEGPKGAPGMPEMLTVTMMLEAMGLRDVALVTDGRFSGASHGPCVGHVTPEAYAGGPIAAVRDGDAVRIDIPERGIEVELSESEIRSRLADFTPVSRPIERGYLQRYRRLVGSAAEGAVLS
ncbi:MAG: dihydroxy-acid dehydratase [Nitrospirae bacterium]|nr:dihydroxy-acid dehydratase [Nitrospirota bacterium]